MAKSKSNLKLAKTNHLQFWLIGIITVALVAVIGIIVVRSSRAANTVPGLQEGGRQKLSDLWSRCAAAGYPQMQAGGNNNPDCAAWANYVLNWMDTDSDPNNYSLDPFLLFADDYVGHVEGEAGETIYDQQTANFVRQLQQWARDRNIRINDRLVDVDGIVGPQTYTLFYAISYLMIWDSINKGIQ
jgi:hypothetical protein